MRSGGPQVRIGSIQCTRGVPARESWLQPSAFARPHLTQSRFGPQCPNGHTLSRLSLGLEALLFYGIEDVRARERSQMTPEPAPLGRRVLGQSTRTESNIPVRLKASATALRSSPLS